MHIKENASNGATDVDDYGSFITTISMRLAIESDAFMEFKCKFFFILFIELFIWSFLTGTASYGYWLGGWLVEFRSVEAEWYRSLLVSFSSECALVSLLSLIGIDMEVD